MTVSHIHSNTAQQTREELLIALGSENNPSQWLVFMRSIKERLPFLMAKRPTNEQYENSAIGQLGFNTWREMLETPRKDGGLGWSWGSWNLWKLAFTHVTEFPYLTELDVKAHIIRDMKKEFPDFPVNIEELEKAQAGVSAQKAEVESNKVANMKAKIIELEQQLLAANAKLSVFENQTNEQLVIVKENVALSAKLEDLVKQSEGVVEQQLKIEKESEKLSAELKVSILENKHLKSMGRWAHFGKWLRG
jgi:hypothetical protein